MGLGFVDEPLLKTLLATLAEVFPHVQVYQPTHGGLVFTGTLQAFEPERTLPETERGATVPRVFAELGIYGGEDIAAHLVLDDEGARSFSRGAPINTDDRNLLQARSPGVARSGTRLDPVATLAAFDPLAAEELPWDRIYLLRRMLASGFVERTSRIGRNPQSIGFEPFGG